MSRATQDAAGLRSRSRKGLSPAAARLSRLFRSARSCRVTVLQPRPRLDAGGLGSSPFARHYLGNHVLFSPPAGNKMFQFPAFAHLTVWRASSPPGCPIRKSADQWLFAPSRGLSQLITSFVASESQGIRHAPFVTFPDPTSPGSLRKRGTTLACPCSFSRFYRFSTRFFNMSKISRLVENIGIEPMTSCLQGRRSSQLS